MYRRVMARGPAGHIERLPSGSWRVKVYAGTDPLTGREIRLRRTCKTERAAQIVLGKLLEQAAAGRQPDSDVTVAQLLDQYQADLSPDHANPSANWPVEAVSVATATRVDLVRSTRTDGRHRVRVIAGGP